MGVINVALNQPGLDSYTMGILAFAGGVILLSLTASLLACKLFTTPLFGNANTDQQSNPIQQRSTRPNTGSAPEPVRLWVEDNKSSSPNNYQGQSPCVSPTKQSALTDVITYTSNQISPPSDLPLGCGGGDTVKKHRYSHRLYVALPLNDRGHSYDEDESDENDSDEEMYDLRSAPITPPSPAPTFKRHNGLTHFWDEMDIEQLSDEIFV